MTLGGREVIRQNSRLGLRLIALAVLYVALAVAAVADLPLVWAVALLLIVVVDLVGTPPPNFKRLLRIGGLEPSALGLLQVLTFGVLLARHFPDWASGEVLAFALLLLVPLSRAAYLLMAFAWRVRFLRPIAVRNIDLGPLMAPASREVAGWGEARLIRIGALALAVGAIGVATDQIWPFVLLTLAYVAVVLSGSAILAARILGWGGLPSNSEWLRRAFQRIRALEPEVIVHFTGSVDAVYQINMWLKPLSDLQRPVLLMLRERAMLAALAPTELPVVCMPDSVTVMSAKLTSARVAMYVAHSGKNIHLLREPGMRHVFIGHGDSDKVSSINPFAKAYDELWVAGPAARERWAAADVGIRDDAIVEVGRPQLIAIDHVDRPPEGGRKRILYAPTWEGWTNEDFGTSITDMGPVLIEGLLAAPGDWEILYKPHPFTGVRDPRARRAHNAIVDMLERANGAKPGPSQAPRVRALTERLSEPGLSAAQFAELSAEWEAAFWSEHEPGAHLVIDAKLPELFSCFNHADAMIADVSSVVSDFLSSGKPYVCANPRGIDPDQFLRENPTTGGAYLLGPDCPELGEILAQIRGEDPLATRRLELREHILGPAEPPSIHRWRDAVDRLAATANVGATSGLDPDLMDTDATELQDDQA